MLCAPAKAVCEGVFHIEKMLKSWGYICVDHLRITHLPAGNSIATGALWTLPLSARDSVLLKYCSSTVHAVSLILLDTPQDPTQLTLMAVEGKHTCKHWEKVKPQV